MHRAHVRAVVMVCMMTGLSPFRCIAGPVTLVTNGQDAAVVVTAEAPSRTAVYAAEELVRHIETATGLSLPVVTEGAVPEVAASRLFIGDTQAARALGIDPGTLGPDEFLLRTEGDDLYILGKELREMDPLQGVRYNHAVLPKEYVNPHSGTLFGVYEVLSRYVGVRWLWPGELGTYVPRTDRLVIEDALDETGGPRLKFRLWAWSHIWLAEQYEKRYTPDIRDLAFTPEGVLKYRDDLEVYLRRHRLGNSEVSPHGVHTFHWWWQAFGKTHPEWFMLNSKGERGPEPGQRTAAMCLSNPDLQRYIVDRYIAGDLYVTGWVPRNRVAYARYIPLGESDTKGGCRCEECRKWNGPQPEELPAFVRTDLYNFKRIYDPLRSNRYARFWKTIYDMAVERDPDVRISVYLYWTTFPAPPEGVELNKGIWGEFAPWTSRESYYPMPEQADQWLREQWLGWRKTGMSLVYRPNYFHCGYIMPHFSTRQAGDFFRWAYAHGMVAVNYDSLYGHWATRGPMLYMLMRLFWNPELEIEALRREYVSGFGPAAGLIETYFDYWEEHSRTRKGGWLHGDVALAYVAFPPAAFYPAEAMLGEALEAARENPLPEFAERVRFLQAGLKHAQLANEFLMSLDRAESWGRKIAPADDLERLARSKQLLRELIGFRRAHEHLHISDYLDASLRENRGILDMAELLEAIR